MNNKKPSDPMRRDFMKKAAYVAPVILTLKAMPALAQVGSGAPVNNNNTSTDLDPVPPETFVAPEQSLAAAAPSAANSKGPTASTWCDRQRGNPPSPRSPRSSKPWYLCD